MIILSEVEFDKLISKFDKLKSTASKTAQVLVGNVVDTISEEEEFSEFF